MDKIDYLLVDEACQATELMCLAPFHLNPVRVVLFGDHKQLPPTCFSCNADHTKLSRSLFERLLDAGMPLHTLTVQYRMHAQIRKFPSLTFYKDQLTDADSIVTRESKPEFEMFRRLNEGFERCFFFDLINSQERQDGSSKINDSEAIFTFDLIEAILI